ncbi:hypothetical protein JNW88_31190 [Micromonospora sp. ATA32]|nr:hypothetical protein [Micromonospora sp. ATA32]
MIETPRYDLTWFKVSFGRLAVKAYTKGEHVLRFEATAHNTKDLKVGRAVDKFPALPASVWVGSGVSRLTAGAGQGERATRR